MGDPKVPVRVISVSEVREIRNEMANLGEVRVFESGGRLLDVTGNEPEILDLTDASDYALKHLGIAVWREGADWPEMAIQLGTGVPSLLHRPQRLDTYDYLPTPDQVEGRVLSIIEKCRRPRVTAAMIPDLLRALIWLVLGAVAALFVVSMWPNVAVIPFALLVVIVAGLIAGKHRRLQTGPYSRARVVVRPELRLEARQQKREHRRVLLGIAGGVVGGVLTTIIVGLISGQWPPQT